MLKPDDIKASCRLSGCPAVHPHGQSYGQMTSVSINQFTFTVLRVIKTDHILFVNVQYMYGTSLVREFVWITVRCLPAAGGRQKM